MVTATPAAAESQRMILAPGCYNLTPGKYFDADAYCLDRAFAAPASGSLLGNAPAGLGQAQIQVNGGASFSLQEGLARHIVQIEGLGDHLQVRIRNLTADKVKICISSPAVVMAAEDGYTGDISKIYDQIVRVVTQHGGIDDQELHNSDSAKTESMHAELQQTLWDAIIAASQHELRRQPVSQRLRPSVELPQFTPNAAQCVGQPGDMQICRVK
jgi:hypothetical protein